MAPPKRDATSGRGNTPRNDTRAPNGDRSKFQTDTAISNKRFAGERTLQPWVPDSNDVLDGSLEKSTSSGTWDQFAENERRFGLTTDYNENFYTTAIDKSHPQYRERMAAAEKKAQEIERSAATTRHVAEERVMDYVAGSNRGDENEEDKYSGVRRQDLPSSSNRETKYTPPAKRAPTGQSSVKGAPIDPAIISSQIRAPPKKQPAPTPDESKQTAAAGINSSKSDSQNHGVPGTGASQSPKDKPEDKHAPTVTGSQTTSSGAASKPATPSQTSGNVSRNKSPHVQEGAASATSTVEADVLKEFQKFASKERTNVEKVRTRQAKADKEVRLKELKKFASSFKLSTPVPKDLVSIIAKDPTKQKEIQEKAMKNAEDIAKTKVEATVKEAAAAPKDGQAKQSEQTSGPPSSADARGRVPTGPHNPAMGGANNRHANPRQQFVQHQYHQQNYRNNRGGPQQMPSQQQTGNLAQRLRNVEQQKYSQPPPAPQHVGGSQDARGPPTGPASSVDPNFNRRGSAVPLHMGARLNPNSNEFRPNPFATAFNPASHASASSSPHSAANAVVDAGTSAPKLVRRKTQAINVHKCNILAQIKTITPPQGRKWDDNGGLRPSYDTLPTWRQLQDNEPRESTMHLTYRELFEQQPFANASLTTPNPPHVVPHLPHQHQLPFHLQQGAQNMGPRQSPHMPPMQMHPQHGPVPHPPYNGEDHRMMHSNSAQSYASPRLGQGSMAYPAMNSSPGQPPYNQQVFMNPGGPQMGQYPRNFSGNPQYMPHQQGQMGPAMMMQPHFMPGPQGMVGAPQMMYPGGPQYMPPSGPPQPGHVANGYPSPGRQAAPMMAHQGSQQGQQMYGMSPGVQYSQPSYGPNHGGGSMANMRGYSSPGPQHYGTSPQQGYQYGPQQRSNSNSYNKNYSSHGQQQSHTPQASAAAAASNGASSAPPSAPAGSQTRTGEGPDEAK